MRTEENKHCNTYKVRIGCFRETYGCVQSKKIKSTEAICGMILYHTIYISTTLTNCTPYVINQFGKSFANILCIFDCEQVP